MEQGRCTAIVLAAGQGKRMHSKIQKQFLEIGGKPILYYSMECFQKSPLIQDIILVTGEDMISYCQSEIVEKYVFLTDAFIGSADQIIRKYLRSLNIPYNFAVRGLFNIA